MFVTTIEMPPFKHLKRGLRSYTGLIDLAGFDNVKVRVQGRTKSALDSAVADLMFLQHNLATVVAPATQEFFGHYEAIKEAVQRDGYALEQAGGTLPEISAAGDVWRFLVLERVAFEQHETLPVRLSFRAPWDVEHDLGVYLKAREFQYAGISV